MSRTQVIVGFTEQTTNGMTLANGIYDTVHNSNDSFVLVNNAGQVVATVASFIPMLRPVTIQFNTLALTLTFSRVLLDFQNNRLPSAGDMLTMVGNAAGIVATFTFLVGASPVLTTVATAVGIAAGIGALLTSDNVAQLGKFIEQTRNNLWGSPPYVDVHEMYYSGPGLPLKSRPQLEADGEDVCWRWGSSPKIPYPERIKCPVPPDPDKNGSDGDSNGT